MDINWWGLPGGWEICGGDYMTWLLRIAGVGLNDPADPLWFRPPFTTPGALSSSRASLFVFEYYHVKQVKMSKTATKCCCAFSVLGMCQETLLHQLLGSNPACQCSTEAQQAMPQATDVLEWDAGEKWRKSLGNCNYTARFVSCLSMHRSHTNPAEPVAGGTSFSQGSSRSGAPPKSTVTSEPCAPFPSRSPSLLAPWPGAFPCPLWPGSRAKSSVLVSPQPPKPPQQPMPIGLLQSFPVHWPLLLAAGEQ